MPQARKQAVAKAHVEDRDKERIARRGVRAAVPIGISVRAAAISALRNGGDVIDAIRQTMGARVTPLIIEMLMAADLTGRARVLRDARAPLRREQKRQPKLGPFAQAIKFVEGRAGLTEAQRATLLGQYGDVAVNVTRGFAEAVEAKAAEAIRTSIAAGDTQAAGIKRLRGAMDAAGVAVEEPILRKQPHLFETLFRTQTNLAYNAGRVHAAEDPAIDEILWGWEYVAILDDRVRPTHEGLNGMRLPKDDPKWATMMPPNGFNSFVAGTVMSGVVEAGSKAWYAGPIVKVQTTGGARLATTINHPILTNQGFVAAGQLRQGHHLIVDKTEIKRLSHCSSQRRIAPPPITDWAIDNQQCPAMIEDIYEAIAAQAMPTTFPGAGPLDFHGDGRFMYGEIDVACVDRILPGGAVTGALKLPKQVSLMLGSHADSAADSPSSMLRERAFVCFGPASQFDAPINQTLADGASRGMELLGQLKQRYAGFVSSDKIVSIQVVPWSGHVYDLQSPNGWIVANGILTSNCRCSVIEIWKEEADLATEKPPDPEFTDPQGVTVEPGPDKGFAFNPGKVLPGPPGDQRVAIIR